MWAGSFYVSFLCPLGGCRRVRVRVRVRVSFRVIVRFGVYGYICCYVYRWDLKENARLFTKSRPLGNARNMMVAFYLVSYLISSPS